MSQAVEIWLHDDPETRLLCAFLKGEMARRWVVLRALEAELLGILLRISNPDVALSKLAWWQGEFLSLVDGRGSHPLSRELIALGCQAAGVAWASATQALATEINAPAAADLDALLLRCLPLGEALCGAPDETADATQKQAMGTLSSIIHLRTRLLRADEFAASETALIPVNLLARYQVHSADISATHPSARTRQLIGELGAGLLQRMQSASLQLGTAPDGFPLATCLQERLTGQWLQRLRDRRRLTTLVNQRLWPLRQCWALWRGARNHRRMRREHASGN